MAKKCVKCQKEFEAGQPIYNYPSGACCLACGKEKAKLLKLMKAKHGLAYAIQHESLITA